jgi:hypothetical protein
MKPLKDQTSHAATDIIRVAEVTSSRFNSGYRNAQRPITRQPTLCVVDGKNSVRKQVLVCLSAQQSQCLPSLH